MSGLLQRRQMRALVRKFAVVDVKVLVRFFVAVKGREYHDVVPSSI
jgi:hypothetical protein